MVPKFCYYDHDDGVRDKDDDDDRDDNDDKDER